MRNLVARFCRDESGSAVIEYCFLASGVLVLSFYLFKGLGGRLLRSLRNENLRLKALLAESMLDVSALRDTRGKI